MVEIKLSQGAKPGHGGLLPGAKVSEEIAETRDVPRGRDCQSPACHSAFTTPRELVEFAARLRELAGGKPVGIKLCVGYPHELFAVVKAMLAERHPSRFHRHRRRRGRHRRRAQGTVATASACRCARG